MAIISNKTKGASMLEILLVIGLITTTFVALLAIVNFSLKIAGQKQTEYRAVFLVRQMMEGLRNFRDSSNWLTNGLGTLTSGAIYHLEKSGSPPKWILASGFQYQEGFTQSIIFSDVRRDSNGNIVASGGNLDSNSKQVQITAAWQDQGQARQVQITSLLTNWR